MTQSEVKSALMRPLAIAAGILGLIQGVAWTVFSFLCILCFFDVIGADPPLNIYRTYVQEIYFIFLTSDERYWYPGSDIIIKPVPFFIFMWFYLVLSILWMVDSGIVLWSATRAKMLQSHKYFFSGWSLLVVLISILDIVLVGILAADLKALDDLNASSDVLVTYGIVMSVAARGYVIWIVNIIFASILAKFSVDLFRNTKNEGTRPIIYGYENDSNVNPPWQKSDPWSSQSPEPQSPYHANGGFTNDNGRGFERSQSFFPIMLPTEPNHQLISSSQPRQNLPPSSSQPEQRLATVGKPGRRSPPRPIDNPKLPKTDRNPYIPDPDYSPPNTPNGLKSALRLKSNY